MFKKLTNRKGFTFIELMIVVAIIGILAGIAIPQYVKYVKRARTAEGLTHVGQAYNALADWFASPDLGNGTNLTPATIESALGTGGKKFQDHFPSEHEWLVTGGGDNKAPGEASSVTGGLVNEAGGLFSAILGGKGETLNEETSHFP